MPREVAVPRGSARLAAVLVVIAVLVAGVAGAGGGGGAPTTGAPAASGGALAGSGAGSAPASASTLQTDSFEQEFRVEVYANGSARWTFVYRRPLTNETDRENFREYARRFTTDETELYRDFRTRARALADRGTEETNRTMNATAFRRDAYVADLGNAGIVEMSFLWTRFAVVDDDRVVVGGVFEGGLYVAPEQRFVLTWGPDLALADADPDPTSRTDDSLTWTGGEEGRQFLDGRPRVVLADPASLSDATTASTATTTPPTTTTTDAGGDGTTDPGRRAGGGSGFLPAAFGALVVLLGLGAALAYRSGAVGGRFGGSTASDDGPHGPGPDAGTGAEAAPGPASDTESAPDGDAGVDTDGDPTPAVSEEELLTDEDRVMGLLEENGGRMKQVSIVEETNWSKSKVSMLLSDMDENDQISKLRVGRENIISLSGREPELAGSPFDEEEEAEE